MRGVSCIMYSVCCAMCNVDICVFFPYRPYSKPVWDHFWKVVLKGWPSVMGLWKLTMFDCLVQGTFCPIMVASHARLVDCRQAHAWDLYASVQGSPHEAIPASHARLADCRQAHAWHPHSCADKHMPCASWGNSGTRMMRLMGQFQDKNGGIHSAAHPALPQYKRLSGDGTAKLPGEPCLTSSDNTRLSD